MGDHEGGVALVATFFGSATAGVAFVVATLAGGVVSNRFSFCSSCSVRWRSSRNSCFSASIDCASCANGANDDASATANNETFFMVSDIHKPKKMDVRLYSRP